jgi:tRNA(Ile2)-agmatinylcytidine synthase
MEQVYLTNQGTDGHLEGADGGELSEGHSYRVRATIAGKAETGRGGHVSLPARYGERDLRCMAFEPTKGFRDVVRALVAGDLVEACGSFKGGSLNLEKIRLIEPARAVETVPPRCSSCGRRMTSAGHMKGYKCRRCGTRAKEGEVQEARREIRAGWYEVPPSARRHLAKPLVRAMRQG